MYGTDETYEGKPAVRFERVYPHPVEHVWRSITVPEELATWFPSRVEVDLREGGAMRFTFDPHLAEPMDGRVVELDPPKVFAFLWGKDLLRLELAPEGTSTRLTLIADARGGRGRAQRLRLARLPRQAGRRGHRRAAPDQECQRRGVPAGAEIPARSSAEKPNCGWVEDAGRAAPAARCSSRPRYRGRADIR